VSASSAPSATDGVDTATWFAAEEDFQQLIQDWRRQFDIHPRDKRTVGHRLAMLALHELGLRAAPASGPAAAAAAHR
jgi:hypothetical protein